jgi:hypothetical protein
MTSKAALAKALLEGKVVNIKNGFHLFGITNVPREIGRSIERAFGVTVSRTNKDGKSRYGQPCCWVDYRLNRTGYNLDGIKKMEEYVRNQTNGKDEAPTTSQGQPIPNHEIASMSHDQFWEALQSGKLDPVDKPQIIQKELF